MKRKEGEKARIEKAFRESIQLKEKFIKENLNALSQIIEVICKVLKKGNKILLFGNGGSAADAQHIAAEFVNRFQLEREPLPAMALTTDTSILTSIGNDYDFSLIFSKQIQALGKRGDIAWAISTSGRSPNVIKALEQSKAQGLTTIGMTGGDGGEIGKIVDYPIVVPSKNTPRIQEVHITIGHVICAMVEERIYYEKKET